MRRKKPEWKKQVDKDMRRYVTCEYTIWHNEELIKQLSEQLTRITTSYIKQEGTPGNELITKEEEYLIKVENYEEVIKKCKEYREHIEKSIQALFGDDPDKLVFIERYWWKTLNRHDTPRIKLVLSALEFLKKYDRDSGRRVMKPNQTFYRWREEIYAGIADLFGYRDN